MFQKPFRVKSNSTVKGSERKKIRAHLEKYYTSLTPEELYDLVPTKSEVSQMKIFTHGGQSVIVYISAQNPVFFEFENQVYPTVYTLWRYPNLLPCFPTWPPVFEKLLGGADLMQPGVVLRGDCSRLKSLSVNDLISVRLVGNKSPVAVGSSAINSDKLFSNDQKGKAVFIFHTYGDLLWASGTKSEPPMLEDDFCLSTEQASDSDDQATNSEQQEVRTDAVDTNLESLNQLEDTVKTLSVTETVAENAPESSKPENDLMDELLTNCFLSAMKIRMKKVELPLLTSTFYSAHMLAFCPSNRTIDVKKSSFKKLSQFLKAMQDEGIIELKVLSKGVESIVAMNIEHELVRRFKPKSKVDEESAVEDTGTTYSPPEIEDLFTVGAAVLPFFKTRRVGKGASFLAVEVRKLLADYVKEKNLQSPQNPRQVVLDPILADTLLNKGEYLEKLTWEELNPRCLSKMQPAHRITFPNHEPMIRKGQIQPIEISVAQRTGNKKVTLVFNLESYGIEPEVFAHQVQVGVAASTSVSPALAKKGLQVMVQGNQALFISKLLLGEYHLPKKYIIGLDKIPAKKNK